MTTQTYYVPVLHWKPGEQAALRVLRPAQKERLRPLIQLIPIPRDSDTDAPKKTFEVHVNEMLDDLVKCWRPAHPFFLDPDALATEETAQARPGWLWKLHEAATDRRLQFIPVVRLRSSADELAAALAVAPTRGACLRLSLNDLEKSSFTAEVDQVLQRLGGQAASVDVILDMASVEDQQKITVISTAKHFITEVPSLLEWRSVTLTATAFPRQVPVKKDDVLFIPRTEWLAWKAVAAMANLQRRPAFGDYGIQYPELPNVDPFIMAKAAAKIRYTLEDQWFAVGGGSFQKLGGEQFVGLARRLVAAPQFKGAAHCKGCEMIVGCSEGEYKAGSLGKWREIGTIHHIALTLEQVAGAP